MAECLELMGMTGKLTPQAAQNLRARIDLIHLEMETAEKQREVASQRTGSFMRR